MMSLPVLAACAMGVSRPLIQPVCPRLVDYSRAVQARAAEELKNLPAQSPLAVMLVDYGKLRDQVRACQKAGDIKAGGLHD
jgi:hypothetical protein